MVWIENLRRIMGIPSSQFFEIMIEELRIVSHMCGYFHVQSMFSTINVQWNCYQSSIYIECPGNYRIVFVRYVGLSDIFPWFFICSWFQSISLQNALIHKLNRLNELNDFFGHICYKSCWVFASKQQQQMHDALTHYVISWGHLNLFTPFCDRFVRFNFISC